MVARNIEIKTVQDFEPIMNFKKPISIGQSNWLRDAKCRKKWRRVRRITLRAHIKYLRIKRTARTM